MRRFLTGIGLAVALTGCGRSDLYRYVNVAVPDAGEADAGAPDAGPLPCVPGTLALKKATPTVMFVLDKSGSMRQRFGTQSRWVGLTNALDKTLPASDASMQVGALLFPGGTSSESCTVNDTANLVPALGNSSKLLALMKSTSPSGHTPSAVAISRAGVQLKAMRAATAARAIVLATDGAPNCNAALATATCRCAESSTQCRSSILCLDDARTVAEISTWRAMGIPTYVLGIQDSNPTFVSTLNAMAVAGGRPVVGGTRSYYPATSQAELESALVLIRNQVGGCVYLTPSLPDLNGTISVTIDGQPIAYDETSTDGWHWGDQPNGEVVLSGTTCLAAAAMANPTVEATIECAAP